MHTDQPLTPDNPPSATESTVYHAEPSFYVSLRAQFNFISYFLSTPREVKRDNVSCLQHFQVCETIERKRKVVPGEEHFLKIVTVRVFEKSPCFHQTSRVVSFFATSRDSSPETNAKNVQCLIIGISGSRLQIPGKF